MKGSLNIRTSWPFLCLHPFPLIAECTALLKKTEVPWQEGGITQVRALNAESCERGSGSASQPRPPAPLPRARLRGSAGQAQPA